MDSLLQFLARLVAMGGMIWVASALYAAHLLWR